MKPCKSWGKVMAAFAKCLRIKEQMECGGMCHQCPLMSCCTQQELPHVGDQAQGQVLSRAPIHSLGCTWKAKAVGGEYVAKCQETIVLLQMQA